VYSLRYTETAIKHIKGIRDRRERGKIKDRIKKLKTDPFMQSKPLRGELEGLRCVRAVGQRYRVLFAVENDPPVVTIHFAGIRKEGTRTTSTVKP
jgi:mRNA interferase RelE/StbE